VSKQALGLSGLVRSGSAAALTAAVKGESSFATYPFENGVLLSSLRNGFRASDPVSVATLGQAAVSSSVANPFREAAAHALASIHTPAALPFLAALLDDPDDLLRIEAIGGFSAFANGLPMQTSANTANLGYMQLPAGAPHQTAETIANFAMGSQAISRNEAKISIVLEELVVAKQRRSHPLTENIPPIPGPAAHRQPCPNKEEKPDNQYTFGVTHLAIESRTRVRGASSLLFFDERFSS
jgi:hypothetical protein